MSELSRLMEAVRAGPFRLAPRVFRDPRVQRLAGSEAWAWVTHLSVHHATARDVPRIADSPLLATITSLEMFSGNFTRIGPAGARALAASLTGRASLMGPGAAPPTTTA